MSAPRVGIVGGGQLARMTHQAAIALGVEVTVLCEEPDAPAVRAGARHLRGRPERFGDLQRLARSVDVVTVDHERTPWELLARLAELGHAVAPGAAAARLGQDKAVARAVLERHGVGVAPWRRTADVGEVEAFGVRYGWPLVLKRPTGGYDGRGVWVVDDPASAAALLDTVGEVLVEPHLGFSCELSVVVARSAAGEVASYPPVETVQRDGQCDVAFTPAAVPPEVAAQARSLAVHVAEAVELVGVMAVELFVLDDWIVLNELAVRPHNSGHLTIEACHTSQFENLLRAVLGLPLGDTDLRVPAACMANLLGTDDGLDPLARPHGALAVPGVSVHRYGKAPRPRRKVGHLTATGRDVEEARRRAAAARRSLLGAPVPA